MPPPMAGPAPARGRRGHAPATAAPHSPGPQGNCVALGQRCGGLAADWTRRQDHGTFKAQHVAAIAQKDWHLMSAGVVLIPVHLFQTDTAIVFAACRPHAAHVAGDARPVPLIEGCLSACI